MKNKPRQVGGASHHAITRRRFLARGAAFALAATVTGPGLTVLSGCGGGGSASEPLSFWQFYGPGGDVKAESRWITDLVDAWNRENETRVELQYIPPIEYRDGTKLKTAFASGEGPDIFINSTTEFLRYYNGGALLDLTPFMEEVVIDDFYPSALATRSVEGKVYAIPTETEPVGMFYSVKAFEDAGLSEADIPTTWEELLEVAGKVQTKEMFGLLLETAAVPHQAFSFYPWLWMGGGDLVTKDNEGSKFGFQGSVRALRFWQECVEGGFAPRDMLGDGSADVVANLASGYCAIQELGTWGVGSMQANAPDFEYGICRLPVPQGGEYTTTGGGWSFVANSRSKNPEEAGKFCAWAVGSVSDECVQRMANWASEVSSVLPPRKSVMERATEQGAFDSGPMKVFKEEVFPGMRDTPRYPPQIIDPVVNAVQACMLDGADPKQQAEQAAQRIDSFLEGYSGAKII